MPTPEQNSAVYTAQVQLYINTAQNLLAFWNNQVATLTNADLPPYSTSYGSQYAFDADLFAAQTYVTSLTSLIAALTAGI